MLKSSKLSKVVCMEFECGEIVDYFGSYFRISYEKNVEEIYITTVPSSLSKWIASKKNLIKLDEWQQHEIKMKYSGNYLF